MIGARDGIDTIVESDSAIKPLKLQSLEEFVQRPSVSFHVRGIVPTQGIVIAFGPPKGGKTFSIGDLTLHAAHGLPEWHGYKIPRRVRVAYLAGEGTLGLKVRFKAWLDHHDNLDKSGDFLVLPEALSLPDNCNEVLELLKPFNPGIVVLDTLNAYFGAGNEDATPDMSAFCCAVRALRDGLKCAIIVIHHTGHGNQGRERGSIVLRASADVLIQVAKDEGGSGNVGFQVLTGRLQIYNPRRTYPIDLHIRYVQP
jgi:RecA-family ATPase